MTRRSEIQLYPWLALVLQSASVRFTLVWDEFMLIKFKQGLNTESDHYKIRKCKGFTLF